MGKQIDAVNVEPQKNPTEVMLGKIMGAVRSLESRVTQPHEQVIQVVQDKKNVWTTLKESSIESAPKLLSGMILLGLGYLGAKRIVGSSDAVSTDLGEVVKLPE